MKGFFVDSRECTGCEYCVDKLPEVFAINAEGVSYVVNINGAHEDAIQRVIDGCPAICIHWAE